MWPWLFGSLVKRLLFQHASHFNSDFVANWIEMSKRNTTPYGFVRIRTSSRCIATCRTKRGSRTAGRESFLHISVVMKKSADPWNVVSLNNYSSDLLNSQKWFETANEITAAMSILEPHVLAWWQSMRDWSRSKGNIMFREHSFAPLYMMLAGFAIENLCKGNAVDQFSNQERQTVRESGILPESLQTHDILDGNYRPPSDRASNTTHPQINWSPSSGVNSDLSLSDSGC
jgi:hypothetical protein